MIKGIIFDLDGVLTFTDKYHFLAWKSIADKENIYFDEKINNRLRGVSRMDSLNIILERATKEYTQEEKEELAFLKNEKYKEYLNEFTPQEVSDDVRFTLDALKKKGYKLAVGSASKNTMMIMEKTDLLKYFDAIADGTKITHSKPDPEVFLLAAKLINLPVDECYVVEDAYAGIDAAFNGKFKSIGIGDASKYERANFHITKLSDILDILKDEPK